MRDFFDMENKYYRMASVLGDIALIGILWIVFSLPIITAGVATTALYYVCTKKSSGKDDYIFRSFLKSFKENFVKVIVISIILILVFYMIWLNLNILPTMAFGRLSAAIYIALYFMFAQAIFVTVYVFPLISRFELSVFNALKSAFFMSNRHLLVTFTNLALLIAIVYASMLFPFLIIFAMGLYIYLSSFLFVKIFRKYYPNFDDALSMNEQS